MDHRIEALLQSDLSEILDLLKLGKVEMVRMRNAKFLETLRLYDLVENRSDHFFRQYWSIDVRVRLYDLHHELEQAIPSNNEQQSISILNRIMKIYHEERRAPTKSEQEYYYIKQQDIYTRACKKRIAEALELAKTVRLYTHTDKMIDSVLSVAGVYAKKSGKHELTKEVQTAEQTIREIVAKRWRQQKQEKRAAQAQKPKINRRHQAGAFS